MSFVNIIIKAYRPKGFGFKIDDKDGILLVTSVSDDGAASEGGMRDGDIIHSINNVTIQFDASEFAKKINDIRGEVQLRVYRDDADCKLLPRSNSNFSDELDQINSNSYEKLTTSTSSIDLNNSGSSRQIIGSSYVPEEHIDTYLQPMSTNDSIDKFSDDNSDQPLNQVTRKQAYKKPLNDIGYLEPPKYSVKRATKSTSFLAKEPAYTVKRKTNTINSNPRPRPSTTPVTNTQTTVVSLNSSWNSNSSNLLVNNDINSSPTIEKSTSSLLSLSESVSVETMVKIISFKDTHKKTNWKNFQIETDTFGVLFHSLDMDETPMASNSTAIDPYISGLDVYMKLWYSNNTISKFFLPIGQKSYDDDIDISTNNDNISIKYGEKDVDFLINYSRLTDDKILTLFTILGLTYEVPETRLPQTKPKRIHGSTDNVKLETKKVKSSKFLSELPRDSMLSHLPQTKPIENIPVVVLICINIIEKIALQNEGIYRISGNESAKKKLENVVFNQSTDTWAEYEEWRNVNTVAALLKSVLRNYSLIDKDTAIKLSMINVKTEINNQPSDQTTAKTEINPIQNYMDMVYHLRQHLCKRELRLDQLVKDRSPQEIQCRLETFKYLIKHLNRLSEYENVNKMSADNLATCFSPTIIEDIPCDGDGEYQTSKKSDADKNLKQMVTFWITNANFICEILDEENEKLRVDRVLDFFESKDRVMLPGEVSNEKQMSTEDFELVVKELVESYTSQAFILGSDNGSISAVDGNLMNKLKTTALPPPSKKKDNPTRRNSTNPSPQQSMKMPPGDVALDSVSGKSVNPSFSKRNDNWSSKSVRIRKKEPQLPQKKVLSLTSMRLSGSVKNVPVIVDVCVNIIEKYGLNVDGVYRVSGKKHDISALENLVVNNQYDDWKREPHVTMWANIHTVCGLLKSILKQFCLIKKETWVHMVSQFSEKMEANDVRKVLMAAAYHLRHEKRKQTHNMMSTGYVDRVVKECEDDIRSATLRFVLKHLKLVSQHESNNRMTSNSLAICFMPVLMEEDESADIVAISNKGIQITEKLIEHCDWIFQWDDRPWEQIIGKEMTDSLDDYLSAYISTSVNVGSKIPSNDNTPEHIIDNDKVHRLLDKSIIKSYILAQSRFTIRRHSDETDVANRKTEYRESKIFDDSQLPDTVTTDDSDGIDIREPQLTDSIL